MEDFETEKSYQMCALLRNLLTEVDKLTRGFDVVDCYEWFM